jgi:arsenic resistance protein ArsH
MIDLPNVDPDHLNLPDLARLESERLSTHLPRILLFYGSLRERSYSRFLTLEAERLLHHFGAETPAFAPRGLPPQDSVPADHPRVQELRELSLWSEG